MLNQDLLIHCYYCVISHCMYKPYLTTPLLMDIWVVSGVLLSQTLLPRLTFIYTTLHVGKLPKEELLSQKYVYTFVIAVAKYFSVGAILMFTFISVEYLVLHMPECH